MIEPGAGAQLESIEMDITCLVKGNMDTVILSVQFIPYVKERNTTSLHPTQIK